MKEEKTNILAKFTLVYIILIIIGLVIIGKIIYFQFFYDKKFIEDAMKTTRLESTIEPTRGDIYSSDGKLLATSVAYFEVGFDPNCQSITQKIFDENIDSLSLCLSKLLPSKSASRYKQEIIAARDKGTRYYRISYNLKYSDFKEIQTFPILRRGRTKGGFIYQKTYKRERPFGELARRTIGTVSSERSKGVGLEDFYDNELKGIEGYTIKERIAGNYWMPVENADYIEPKDGVDLITTIDINLQDITETALERRMRYHNAEFGTCVLMEVSTGKVRAIANLKKSKYGNYIEEVNYAVGHAADPGSTFKLASMIVALEDGYVKPDDIIETGNGETKYYGKIMKDTKKGGYGSITAQRCFEVSSNVGISKIIHNNYRLQASKYIEGLYKLDLNKKLDVSIRGEATPIIHKPGEKEWSGLSLTQMSIGYELQITPLQILSFYNAIANKGKKMRPIFAEALSYRGEIVKQYEPEVINEKICSDKTIEIVDKMLLGVVENGTASNIKSNNYLIAGKTGTAQMQYGNDTLGIEYHASFVGYFPADKPMYSCVVSIYKPREFGFYGGTVAAPVFKEIAEKIYALNSNYHTNDTNKNQTNIVIPIAKKGNVFETQKVYQWLQIENNSNEITQTNWVSTDVETNKVKFYPVSYSNKHIIPNVLNMGLKDAVLLLEEFGLKVNAIGRGKVIEQVPQQGNTFKKGDHVTIILNL